MTIPCQFHGAQERGQKTTNTRDMYRLLYQPNGEPIGQLFKNERPMPSLGSRSPGHQHPFLCAPSDQRQM